MCKFFENVIIYIMLIKRYANLFIKTPWKFLKNFLDRVDFPIKTLYNSKACKISDEVRCGYSLWNTKVGGNSYGVCRGLDQGGKLFKIFDFRR